MPHRRSQIARSRRVDRANQRREAARIVSQSALRDPELAESINRLTPGAIALRLQKKFGTFDNYLVNTYDKGEVLSDSLGRGTLQQIGVLI
jgi:hypothetical protein